MLDLLLARSRNRFRLAISSDSNSAVTTAHACIFDFCLSARSNYSRTDAVN